MDNKLVKIESAKIVPFIYFIRNEKVMIDRDLANLYGVETKRLKEAVKRNIERFPSDFMFELSQEEYNSLRSQFATLKNEDSKRGKHSKYNPYAFTEQGVAMLSSVLNSKRAIQVNISIMRAFAKIRQFALTNSTLAKKIEELEKVTNHKFSKLDKEIKLIFEAIKQLIKTESKPKNPLGFLIPKKR
jgi:hypothetical protein